MQRLKDKELDPSKPHLSDVQPISSYSKKAANEISMTKPDVVRKIRVEELKSPKARENAWFVVRGEVYNIIIYFLFLPRALKLE
jgi:nitrate reductase (NAD(P)H)